MGPCGMPFSALSMLSAYELLQPLGQCCSSARRAANSLYRVSLSHSSPAFFFTDGVHVRDSSVRHLPAGCLCCCCYQHDTHNLWRLWREWATEGKSGPRVPEQNASILSMSSPVGLSMFTLPCRRLRGNGVVRNAMFLLSGV